MLEDTKSALTVQLSQIAGHESVSIDWHGASGARFIAQTQTQAHAISFANLLTFHGLNFDSTLNA